MPCAFCFVSELLCNTQSESAFALSLRGNPGNCLNQLLKATSQEVTMPERFSGLCVQKEASQEPEYRNLTNITTAKARLDLGLQDEEPPPHSRSRVVSSQHCKLHLHRYTGNTLQRKQIMWCKRVFLFLSHSLTIKLIDEIFLSSNLQ